MSELEAPGGESRAAPDAVSAAQETTLAPEIEAALAGIHALLGTGARLEPCSQNDEAPVAEAFGIGVERLCILRAALAARQTLPTLVLSQVAASPSRHATSLPSSQAPSLLSSQAPQED